MYSWLHPKPMQGCSELWEVPTTSLSARCLNGHFMAKIHIQIYASSLFTEPKSFGTVVRFVPKTGPVIIFYYFPNKTDQITFKKIV